MILIDCYVNRIYFSNHFYFIPLIEIHKNNVHSFLQIQSSALVKINRCVRYKKMKIRLIIFIIILSTYFINCKTEFQAADCEKQYTPNLIQGCNETQPDLDFCLLTYSSYYRCKQNNSKRHYNKLDFK